MVGTISMLVSLFFSGYSHNCGIYYILLMALKRWYTMKQREKNWSDIETHDGR